jgi:hypothetical protein
MTVDTPGAGELLNQPEPPPALGFPGRVTMRSRRGLPSRTAMWSRLPRSSSRSRISVWAWTIALVTSSLANNTARSITVASGRAAASTGTPLAQRHGLLPGRSGRGQPQLVAQVRRPSQGTGLLNP